MRYTSQLLTVALLCLIAACSGGKADDYTGTFVGTIRGKHLSMFLRQEEGNRISGTIFDRGSRFTVQGEVSGGRLTATAEDTVARVTFDVDAQWEKDTLVWMMAMTKPTTSVAFPVRFIRVFISSNEKGLGEVTGAAAGDKDNSAGLARSFPGLWQVRRAEGRPGEIFAGREYLFFNADRSISCLDRTLIPLPGHTWTIGGDSLYVTSKAGGREVHDNLGRLQGSDSLVTVRGRHGMLELRKAR